jgi:hypothetical protein
VDEKKQWIDAKSELLKMINHIYLDKLADLFWTLRVRSGSYQGGYVTEIKPTDEKVWRHCLNCGKLLLNRRSQTIACNGYCAVMWAKGVSEAARNEKRAAARALPIFRTGALPPMKVRKVRKVRQLMCGWCSKPFETLTYNARYCNERCRVAASLARRKAENEAKRGEMPELP